MKATAGTKSTGLELRWGDYSENTPTCTNPCKDSSTNFQPGICELEAQEWQPLPWRMRDLSRQLCRNWASHQSLAWYHYISRG